MPLIYIFTVGYTRAIMHWTKTRSCELIFIYLISHLLLYVKKNEIFWYSYILYVMHYILCTCVLNFVKVRTLEQALEKELNMDRRLHGWSRDGVGMDRDDFVDLAYVSKQVPGKTPTEVSVIRCILRI